MLKYRVEKYRKDDSMSDLICDNFQMLLLLGRFGIDLGFGEQTIEEVCLKSGVDVETFLAVVNVLIAEDKRSVKVDYQKISLSSLVDYLHNSHGYYLEYRLPLIRQQLVCSLDSDNCVVSEAIINYYDEYVAEVNKHMMYEERVLFPYVKAIICDKTDVEYSIDIYSEHHDSIEVKLTDLKNIMIKYYPSKSTNELNNVLHEIFLCEKDLALHNSLEDYLLVPTIKEFENLQQRKDV